MANLKIGAEVPVSEIRAGMDQSADAVRDATRRMGAHFTELERTSSESMRRQREGVKLAAEDMHVHLSRSLTTIIAKSETLGPIFASAFEATAAIAFAQVIADAADKMSKLAAETFIFGAAEKAAFASSLAANKEHITALEKTKALEEARMRIGLDARGITNREIAAEIANQQKLSGIQAAHDQAVIKAEGDKQAAIQRTAALSKGDTVGNAEAQASAGALAAAEQHLANVRNAQQSITDAVKVSEANLSRLRSQSIEDDKNEAKQAASEFEAAQNKRNAALQKTLELQWALRKMSLDAANAAVSGARAAAAAEQDELDRTNAVVIARFFGMKAGLDREHAMEMEDASFKEQMAQLDLDRVKQSGTASLAEERKYLDRVFELKRAAILREIAFLNENDPDTPLKKKKLYHQLEILEKEHNNRTEQIQREHAARMAAIVRSLGDLTATALNGWLSHTQSFASAMAQMWNSIASSIMSAAIRMAIAWAFATDAQKREAIKQAFINAKLSAVHAFKWVMATIPWPANAIIAPLAAAAAFAANIAFATFAKGGLVPGTGNGDTVPALLTPGEYVVPKELAGFAAELFGGSQAAARSRVEGRGATVNVHNHVQAVDGHSFAKMLRSNRRIMGREFSRLARNGAFRFAQ